MKLLSGLRGPPPKVIWLRRGNQATSAIEQMLRREVEAMLAFDQDGDVACLEIY